MNFTSVQAAGVLYQEGLKFIEVVKTATMKYQMKNFQTIKLQKREDRIGLVRRKKKEWESVIYEPLLG